MIPGRLVQARSFSCETVDVSKSEALAEQIEAIVGVPEVDSSVDCVGFEARGYGTEFTKTLADRGTGVEGTCRHSSNN